MVEQGKSVAGAVLCVAGGLLVLSQLFRSHPWVLGVPVGMIVVGVGLVLLVEEIERHERARGR